MLEIVQILILLISNISSTIHAQTKFTTNCTDATTDEVSTVPYETSTIVSACKELGENYRVFPEDGKCYRVTGQRGGPCPYSAIFLEENEINGTCICVEEGYIYFERRCHVINAQGPCEVSQRLTTDDKHDNVFCADYPCGAYVYRRKVLASVKWTNGKCYHEYSRGPCAEGERIVLEKKWKTECEKGDPIAGGNWYSLNPDYWSTSIIIQADIECPPGYITDQAYGCRKEQKLNLCDSGQSWNPFARKCL